MALIKNAQQKDRATKTVSVNYNEDLINRFKKWDGKSLIDVDAKETLTSIEIGRKEWEGGEIVNLVIGMKNEKIAFPLSRGFADTVDEDPSALLEGEFYVRHKMGEGDTEGEYPYTGPLYISFGKTAGLTFDKVTSLIDAEVVDEEK